MKTKSSDLENFFLRKTRFRTLNEISNLYEKHGFHKEFTVQNRDFLSHKKEIGREHIFSGFLLAKKNKIKEITEPE